MKAIIVGAGIAGLVAARQLGLAGWDVEVLEKSPAPRPDGYMMDFFGPGVEASERIGLYPRLAAVAYHVKAVEYVNADLRPTASLDYDQFARIAGEKVLSLLRPDMERAAVAALEDVPNGRIRVRYGAQLSGAWADDDGAGVAVGSSAEALPAVDLLIGADGVHSGVRAHVFGLEENYLHSLGMRAAAFIVTDPGLNSRFRNRFVLTDTLDRMAGLYSLRTDQVAAFLVYRDTDGGKWERQPQSTRERLRSEFAGLGDAVDRLLELCPEHPYDDVVAQVVMPAWHRGRAVLIGDACGAVSLLAGQGGSLAIAGAALLGDLVGPVDSGAGIGPALAEFERRWRPVVEAAQAAGRRAASSFLPANRLQRVLRRWIIRATHLPGIDRLVARQIVGRIAK
ncbi:FAD-dependent monooxygenase [Paenarthrobacter aromaticivorans]|uniref:FAD-dependent monooxygenase n=1 Tax=Paenarthrobacter aromaticivorans TaxID=2849150 RepID=UPI003A811E95